MQEKKKQQSRNTGPYDSQLDRQIGRNIINLNSHFQQLEELGMQVFGKN